MHTTNFTGVPFRIPSFVILARIGAEISGECRICPALPGHVILSGLPVRVFGVAGSADPPGSAVAGQPSTTAATHTARAAAVRAAMPRPVLLRRARCGDCSSAAAVHRYSGRPAHLSVTAPPASPSLSLSLAPPADPAPSAPRPLSHVHGSPLVTSFATSRHVADSFASVRDFRRPSCTGCRLTE